MAGMLLQEAGNLDGLPRTNKEPQVEVLAISDVEEEIDPGADDAPSDMDHVSVHDTLNITTERNVQVRALTDRTAAKARPEAAHASLGSLNFDRPFDLTVTHLPNSPYPHAPNHLDLTTLSPQSRLLFHALSTLTPTTPSYATTPYTDAFNWPHVFATLRGLSPTWQRQDFYVVVFRLTLRRGADRHRLSELDRKSHEEACASGGLLRYWFGTADAAGRNLATCESLFVDLACEVDDVLM